MQDMNVGDSAIKIASSQTIEIIDSTFYNVNASAFGGCLSLILNAKYIVRNSIFERCSTATSFGAIYAPQPAIGSIFEDLTFKDNVASGYAADLYMNNEGRDDGDIIINGTWVISGSNAKTWASSMIFLNDNSDVSKRWTLNMNNWTIENTQALPAMYLDRIDFVFDNLNATGNEVGIVSFIEFEGTRNYSHIIQNSYFKLNGGVLFSYESYVFQSESSLTFTDNVFDNNNGGILALSLSDKTNTSLPILISDSIFMNHSTTTQFTIQSDEDSYQKD